MKGIIIAGGTGSRLLPLTKVTNKCLLPIGRVPLVCRTLELLTSSGVDNVMLVTSPDHMGQVISLLGSGSEYGCSMSYKVQDHANGIAAALGLCKNFVNNDKFVVILGDNIFSNHDEISPVVTEFFSSNEDYRLFTKKVPDPRRFGVPVFSNGKVIDIVEKPKDPQSNEAVVGLYCYTSEVFDVIEKLKPSNRGEYEISDVNSWVVKNRRGSFFSLDCEWIDAGTHEAYRKANEMVWRSE